MTLRARFAHPNGAYEGRWFKEQGDQTTERFATEAEAAGLHHLRGHPCIGGLRASLYNAMPQAGVDALVDFMAHFQRCYG